MSQLQTFNNIQCLWSQHTDTSKNTKAWAVSQHTDASNNTKAWVVPQHTDTSNPQWVSQGTAIHNTSATQQSKRPQPHSNLQYLLKIIPKASATQDICANIPAPLQPHNNPKGLSHTARYMRKHPNPTSAIQSQRPQPHNKIHAQTPQPHFSHTIPTASCSHTTRYMRKHPSPTFNNNENASLSNSHLDLITEQHPNSIPRCGFSSCSQILPLF